jgi:uncharacterized protein (TIGR03118 family)
MKYAPRNLQQVLRGPKGNRPVRHPLILERLEDRCLLNGSYVQTDLVSDIPGRANFTDPDLVNPWGLVASSRSPWWVNDNGTGLSTLYNGSGVKQGLVVTIPPPMGSPAGTTATPTGIVFNGTSDFLLTSSPTSQAFFIFATEDGTISGWNPTVDLTHAVLKVDNFAAGAVYKGLALGSNSSGNFLYATNFHAGTVDVFDASFHPVTLSGSFTDPNILPGYAPFGIRDINGNLYVTYAKQNAEKHDDVAGPAHGFVDVFDTNGNLLQHLIQHGQLNSPWGLALAPADFGQFSNDLLVGNFGNGRINAYDPNTGDFIGRLTSRPGNPIVIDGLWGLSFGNGGNAGPTNTLFFTAGLNDEADGLFGTLQAADSGGGSAAPSPSGGTLTLLRSFTPNPDSAPLPSRASVQTGAALSAPAGEVTAAAKPQQGSLVVAGAPNQGAVDHLFAGLQAPLDQALLNVLV